MAEHNEKGDLGEELAAMYLKEKGYEVLHRKWRYGKEEIDIIAQEKDELVIVEVKTRSGSFFGEPEDFVNRKKQKHLVKAANAYMEENDTDMEVRFDVIGIILTGSSHQINHIKDAFVPIA